MKKTLAILASLAIALLLVFSARAQTQGVVIRATNGAAYSMSADYPTASNVNFGETWDWPALPGSPVNRPMDVEWSDKTLAVAGAQLLQTLQYSNRPARILSLGDSMADYGRQQDSVFTGFTDYLKGCYGDAGIGTYGWDINFHPWIFRTAGRADGNAVFNDPAICYSNNGTNDAARAFQGGYYGTAPVHLMPVNQVGLFIAAQTNGGTISVTITNYANGVAFSTNININGAAYNLTMRYTNWPVPLATNNYIYVYSSTGTNLIFGPEFTVNAGHGVETFAYALGGSALNQILNNGDSFLTNLLGIIQPDLVLYQCKYGNTYVYPWTSAQLAQAFSWQQELFNDVEIPFNTNVVSVSGVPNTPIVVMATLPTQGSVPDLVQNSNQWLVTQSDGNQRWFYADMNGHGGNGTLMFQNGLYNIAVLHPSLSGSLSLGISLAKLMCLDTPPSYNASAYPYVALPGQGNYLMLDNNNPAVAIPNAAQAYALWRLNSAYFGPLLTVRRSSDSATNTIGWNATGYLDTNALLAFAQGGTVYVTTWWDQSGASNNAVNYTTTTQPYIVTNGALMLNSSNLPAVYFPGAITGGIYSRLGTEHTVTYTNGLSLYAVISKAWGAVYGDNETLLDIALTGTPSGMGARIATSGDSTVDNGAFALYGAGISETAPFAGWNIGDQYAGASNTFFISGIIGTSGSGAWVNGSASRAAGVANGTPTQTAATVNIGYDNWASGQAMTGFLSCLVAFGTNNTTAQQQWLSSAVTNVCWGATPLAAAQLAALYYSGNFTGNGNGITNLPPLPYLTNNTRAVTLVTNGNGLGWPCTATLGAGSTVTAGTWGLMGTGATLSASAGSNVAFLTFPSALASIPRAVLLTVTNVTAINTSTKLNPFVVSAWNTLGFQITTSGLAAPALQTNWGGSYVVIQ